MTSSQDADPAPVEDERCGIHMEQGQVCMRPFGHDGSCDPVPELKDCQVVEAQARPMKELKHRLLLAYAALRGRPVASRVHVTGAIEMPAQAVVYKVHTTGRGRVEAR